MPPAPESLTRPEARQRAELIRDLSYRVELDLARGAENFGSQVEVTFAASPGADTFIEVGLERLEQVELNGQRLEAEAGGDRIALRGLLERNRLLVRGESRYERAELGLHLSRDPSDGEHYIYADLEPYEAHRVFACFDQPDLKGSIELLVRAPREWTVVSAEPGEAEAQGAERRWRFPPTMPLSVYTLGIAAGPLHQAHGEHRGIPLGLYCARSLAPLLDQENLFRLTAAGLDYYQRVFGLPYPFSKYDQVFCPEKVNGAMESPGCVTLSDLMLWRGRPSPYWRSWRTDVVLHEMAHMWFGDLVTMRWWDDLWLNESFATVLASFAGAATGEDPDAWINVTSNAKPLARAQDQRRTSHPVIFPVANVEEIRSKFDRITYEKGSAVLRQLVAFVGEDNFFRGLHRYLARYRGGNAEFSDLVAELERASGRDLREWVEAWLHAVGINTLALSGREESGGGLRLVQSASPGQPRLRPHRVRVGFFDWAGDTLQRVASPELDLEGGEAEVPAPEAAGRAPLALANDGDLSYAKIRLDRRSLETVEAHLSAVADPLARALIWDSSWDMVRDAELAAHQFVSTVVRNLAGERRAALVSTVLLHARSALHSYGARARRGDGETRLAELAEAALGEAEPGSETQLAWLLGLLGVLIGEERLERAQGWLAGRGLPPGVELDGELRWVLLRSLAARGAAGEREIAAVLETDPSSTGRMRAEVARAIRPEEAAKARAWARFHDPECTLEEAYRVASTMAGVDQEELMLPYSLRFMELLEQLMEERGAGFTVEFGNWLPFSLVPSPQLVERCRLELERKELHPDLRRVALEVLDDSERMLRAQALDQGEGPEA